jgi:hypothetical protein
VHIVGHVASVPPHTYGAQVGLPPLPAGSTMHAPAEQFPHAPHAVLQHTPDTQLPDVHWSVAVQVELLACLGVHCPPLQYAFEAQFASVVQLPGQSGLEPPHRNGAHDGLPAVPEARFVHVPLAQLPQGPHVVLQHTPPTQLPLVHWSAVVHVALFVSLGMHAPPLQ